VLLTLAEQLWLAAAGIISRPMIKPAGHQPPWPASVTGTATAAAGQDGQVGRDGQAGRETSGASGARDAQRAVTRTRLA
jgi:hypothetical protein